MNKINGVYIIESLNLEEEEKGLFEGKVLKEMLLFLDVKVKYVYIRTQKELKVMIKEFEESKFKYLHLSCHGNEDGIGMTLDKKTIMFSELNDMFDHFGHNKRLFLSSCNVMNGNNIQEEMSETQFLSITGPLDEIDFNDAAIFWASFYHLMFKGNKSSFDNDHMKKTIKKLAITFNVEMSTIIKRKKAIGYNRYSTKEDDLEKAN